MQSGEEVLRTKGGNSNSYNASYQTNEINYSLKINVVDETTENNFTTVSISEDEFNKNY